MILGITGTVGAGKGTVVAYLVKKGFVHYSVRAEIAGELERRGLPPIRPNLNEVGTELRKTHGPAYFPQLFMERAAASGITNAVIESIRNPKEAEYIQEHGGFMLVVDADEQVRYERIKHRASATDAITFEEFRAQEAREMTSEDSSDPAYMDMTAVIKRKDATVMNDGTLAELEARVEAALATLK